MKLKIAITGPESSGKTTLAKGLAEHYNTKWVPEYAREYLSRRKGKYKQADLDIIAKRHLERMNEEAYLLFIDTEMLVMKIWSEFKYGSCSDFIQKAWEDQKVDLYLLCAPDIPYEEDELRENPEDRDELYDLYLNSLKASKRPYLIVSGPLDRRLDKVTNWLEREFFP